MAGTRFLNPESMPKPASNYSQVAIVTGPGQRVVLSGQIGVTAEGTLLKGYQAQAEQAWRNVLAGLADCGMGLADIVSIRVYDTTPGDVGAYRQIRDRMLAGHAPACTYVIVAGLAGPDLLTEIEVEAFSARS